MVDRSDDASCLLGLAGLAWVVMCQSWMPMKSTSSSHSPPPHIMLITRVRPQERNPSRSADAGARRQIDGSGRASTRDTAMLLCSVKAGFGVFQ